MLIELSYMGKECPLRRKVQLWTHCLFRTYLLKFCCISPRLSRGI